MDGSRFNHGLKLIMLRHAFFYLVLFFLDRESERERQRESERERQRQGKREKGRGTGGERERPFLTLKISVAKYCKFFIWAETDFSFCNNSSRLDFCLDIVFLEPYDVCH